jgi:DNA-binding MarR family transcriptional regulator
METKGLLARQQCPSDARSCWIGMTKKGTELVENAFPLQMQEVDRLFLQALTEEQLKSLIEISQAIKKNVSEKTKAD